MCCFVCYEGSVCSCVTLRIKDVIRNAIANLTGFNIFIRVTSGGVNLIRVSRITKRCIDSIGSCLGLRSGMGIGVVSISRGKGVTLSVGRTRTRIYKKQGPSRRAYRRSTSVHHSDNASHVSQTMVREGRVHCSCTKEGSGPHPDHGRSGPTSFRSGLDQFLGSDSRELLSLGHGIRSGHNNHKTEHAS